MVKQIQFNFFSFLLFSTFLLYGASSIAQDKKPRKPSKSQTTPAGPEGSEKSQPASQPAESEKVKTSSESYSFIVFVNPTDEQAQEIWKTLPNKIMGMEIITSGSNPQINFVFSRNPEIALFKRAYGSYFQIFSREDMDTFKQSLPCFNELDAEFKVLLEKRTGQ